MPETITTSTVVTTVFSDTERLALGGFLAGYSGQTRDAYSLDLRQYAAWCTSHRLRLFDARRADIEAFGRALETASRARATVSRRLCTVAGRQNIQSAASDARAAKTFEDTGIVVDRLDEHTAGGTKTILDRLDQIEARLPSV